MKQIFTLMLLSFSLVSSAQKMPKAPKPDATGKESLWENFTSNNAFEILGRTKKIAIMPATGALFARKTSAENLQKSQAALNESSSDLQKIYFSSLYNKKLSALLQDPDETNRILSERNLLNVDALNKTPKNTLCFLLGVDAVLFIDVTSEILKSDLAGAALSVLSLDGANEELAIGLRMYEKANGDFFWANQFSEKPNSKETTQAVFKKMALASIKKIPFVIK